MRTPSTTWREDIAPDEGERFHRYSDELTALQQARSKKQGKGALVRRPRRRNGDDEIERLIGVQVRTVRRARYRLAARRCLRG